MKQNKLISQTPHFSRKINHKGKACRRGKPVYYDEVKRHCNLMLTPKAIEVLGKQAEILNISRSEVIERLLRKLM
jgi:hypothetical protein